MSEHITSPMGSELVKVKRSVSRRYQVARSVWTTLAALLVGLVYLVFVVFALDSLGILHEIAKLVGVELRVPLIAPLETSAWVFIGCAFAAEVLLNGLEVLASKRTQRSGFTLPLMFIPGGRLARLVVLLPLWLITVLPKLTSYFTILSLRLLMPFVDRWPRVQRAVDGVALSLGVCAIHAALVAALVLSGAVAPEAATIGWLAIALWPTLGALWAVTRVRDEAVIDRVDAAFEPLESVASRLYNLLFYTKIRPGGGAFSTLFNASLGMWCLNQ